MLDAFADAGGEVGIGKECVVEVVEAVMRAARRFDHFPSAVRVLEGLKVKVEKESQYEEYLKELKPLMEELGVISPEELYAVGHTNRVYHGKGEGQEIH